MTKERKCIVKVIQQLSIKYPDKTIGQIIDESVGRGNMIYTTDEELLELLERYLELGKVNYN